MGNFLSPFASKSSDRVKKITVTEEGVVKKLDAAPRPRRSFVRFLCSSCCGRVSTAGAMAEGGDREPGVARFKMRRRMFENKGGAPVAPVCDGEVNWAISRYDFKTFANGNVFVTSASHGAHGKEDDSSIVTDESSEILSSRSSTHSVANADLRTLKHLRKKCGYVDTEVELEIEEDANTDLPLGFIEIPEDVEAKGTTTPSPGVADEEIVGESKGTSEDEALPEPMPEKIKRFDEPRTIIPVRPPPLVDAEAGDIPVVERSPVLLNKKDDDGSKETCLPGAALPSFPTIPLPAKNADKDAALAAANVVKSIPADKDAALAAANVVKSIPVVAKGKTLGQKLLPLRAMLSMDVILSSDVQASAPAPAKPSGILNVESGKKPKSVSFYYARAADGCQKDVIPTISMGSSDSEEEIEYFDANGLKIPKPRFTSGNGCASQVELMAKKSELPPGKKKSDSFAKKARRALSKKKAAKQKKRKAKLQDRFVAPAVISVDKKHRDTGVRADHQLIYDEGELSLGVPASNVVDHVIQVKRQPEKTSKNNIDEDSEEEIEYFYPDGSVIPKGSEHIAKIVPSVLPPNNCFSQAQLMSKEYGIKLSSCRGNWM